MMLPEVKSNDLKGKPQVRPSCQWRYHCQEPHHGSMRQAFAATTQLTHPDWSWLVQQRAQTSWDPRERQRNQRLWFARQLKKMRQIPCTLFKTLSGLGRAGLQGFNKSLETSQPRTWEAIDALRTCTLTCIACGSSVIAVVQLYRSCSYQTCRACPLICFMQVRLSDASRFASLFTSDPCLNLTTMAQQDQALPVLHPVTDYEKIKRVGEGTYGVVCKLAGANFTSLLKVLLAKACACPCCRQGKAPQDWGGCCPEEAQNGQGKGWCEQMTTVRLPSHDLSHIL